MRSDVADATGMARRGQVLAGITKLKQICNHPATITDDDGPSALAGRSGKLDRLVGARPRRSSKRARRSSCSASTRRSCAGSPTHLRTELGVGVENLDGKMARTRARQGGRAVQRSTAGRRCCACRSRPVAPA